MRNFWALPAVLRIALASPHSFSVFDDILAFPQYEVEFPDTFITEQSASSLVAHAASHSPSSAATPDSQETQELSQQTKHAPHNTPHEEIIQSETYEPVVLNGQRYLCSIPTVLDNPRQNSTTSSEQDKQDEEKELMRAADRGWELLEGMQGNCIYYLSGWWSYSFCYNGEVRQFHRLPPGRGIPNYPPVEDTNVGGYVLGRFSGNAKDKTKGGAGKKGEQGTKMLDGEKARPEGEAIDDYEGVDKEKASGKGSELATLETKGSARYMVQRLGGGTECDITGLDRKIEVQFHCDPQHPDHIAMIKETSTCTYLMIIHTPRLCHDVAFLPPQQNLAHPISCRPVIANNEVDAWTVRKLQGHIHDEERLIAEEQQAEENPLRDIADLADDLLATAGRSAKRPVVGGIEVGAQRLVGSEGKVIEKSIVVGGGEKFLGTFATSGGFQMSKEELAKLNIKDAAAVNKWKEQQAKSAGGKKWRMDLVETPHGRIFKWIVEDEDEESGAREEGAAKGAGVPKVEKQEKKETTQKGGRKEEEVEVEGEDEEEGQYEGSEEVYKDEL